MTARPVKVDGVTVRRLSYPWRDRAAMITVARVLGWSVFNTPKDGYQFPVRGLHPIRGNPDDLRSRENVPDFGSLGEAWDVLNYFAGEKSMNRTMLRLAFWRLIDNESEAWKSIDSAPASYVVQKIMNAAYSAIVAGDKAGWL